MIRKRINKTKIFLMSILMLSIFTFVMADYTWDISLGNVFGWTLQRGGGFAVGYNQAGSGSDTVWGPLSAYLPDGSTYPAIYETSATPTSGKAGPSTGT